MSSELCQISSDIGCRSRSRGNFWGRRITHWNVITEDYHFAKGALRLLFYASTKCSSIHLQLRQTNKSRPPTPRINRINELMTISNPVSSCRYLLNHASRYRRFFYWWSLPTNRIWQSLPHWISRQPPKNVFLCSQVWQRSTCYEVILWD